MYTTGVTLYGDIEIESKCTCTLMASIYKTLYGDIETESNNGTHK